MRQCIKCLENKGIAEFYLASDKRHRDTKCKDCAKRYKSEYYRNKRDSVLRAASDYRDRLGPDTIRDKNLRQKFGIGLEEYAELLKAQGGACDICKSSNPGRKDRTHFCVDHDHETGKVRGLLCYTCNFGIGGLKDSVEILTSAIAYLKKHGK